MTEQEMAKLAAQTQYADMQGCANASLNKGRPPAIRERVNEANKRLAELNGKLSFLAGEVAPPLALAGCGNDATCEQVRESTLTADIDELIYGISRIEAHVSRLAVAITG